MPVLGPVGPTAATGWPVLIDEAVSFQTGPNSTMPAPYWCSMIGRSMGTWASQRGRQYELDQVQTGTASTQYKNTDGALDPGNVASPFYPQVKLYRAYRRRAQHPATVNLLLPSQATAGVAPDTPGGASLAAGVLPPNVFAGAFGLTTLNNGLWGHDVYSVNAPNSPTAGSVLMTVAGWSVTPGLPFAGRVQVLPSGGISPSPQFAIQFKWYDASGNVISTSTGTPVTATTFTYITGVATAPSNAAGATVGVVISNSPTTGGGVTLYNWQVEQNSSSSAWVQPNPWYDLFTGFVERWPQTWVHQGIYGVSNPQIIDAFGYLSQRKILSPAYMEMLQLGPSFLYPLDEAAGATLFYDLTANEATGQIRVYPGGTATAAQAAAGSALTSSSGTVPSGIGGPVVTFNNPGTTPPGAAAVIVVAPGAWASQMASGAWTNLFAYRTTSQGYIWNVICPSTASSFQMFIEGAGHIFITSVRNNTATFATSPGAPTNNGNWHLMAITVDSTGKVWTTFLDGVQVDTQTLASDGRPVLASDTQGLLGAQNSLAGFVGDVSLLGMLPYAATPTQIASIWSAFQYGGSGLGTATSATRYQDILRWAGWAGQQSEQSMNTGQTVAYGPGVELLASAADQGTDAVSGLQTVVDTENGNHYVDRSGVVTLKARGDRYARITPQVVFGEHTASGEIPYQDVGFDFDPTRVANDTAITQTSTGATVRQLNQASINDHGDIQLQRNVNTLDPLELTSAGQEMLRIYADPSQRVEAITVDVGAYPTAWPSLLGLELGSPVRIMRRPPGGVRALQFDGFVEQINWSMDGQGHASCTLQISPNYSQRAFIWDTSRWSPDTGSMTVTCTAGATSISIATAGSSPTFTTVAGAYPLDIILDAGTVNAEQITLTAAPAGSTSPQTFTVTRGVNGTTAVAHTAAPVTLAAAGFWVY